MSKSKRQVIYIYDPLCGWCYGFTPHLMKWAEAHPELNFTVFSGGMVTGDRVGPIREVASYISKAYKNVEERSGISFGKPFLETTLEKGEAIFNSVPPAKALVGLKSLQAGDDLDYAHRIQKAIYEKGHPPEGEKAYVEIAKEVGIDPEEYQDFYRSAEAENKMNKEFELVKTWGIEGFPTLVLLDDGKGYVLTRGFTDADGLDKAYQQALGRINQGQS